MSLKTLGKQFQTIPKYRVGNLSKRISIFNGLSTRNFCVSPVFLIKRYEFPPRPKISEDDIEEVFIKGGGKGGQKINKTNSKVQLKHIPTGIVVSSQFSRSREQNRAKAREILALKIEDLNAPEGESRTAIIAAYKQNKARKKKAKARKKYAERDAAVKSTELEVEASDEPNLEESLERIEPVSK